MARCLMPLVLLAALLAPSPARPDQNPQTAPTRPEASDHIREGLAHFERAFYGLVPQKRHKEADVEFDLAVAAFQRELAQRPASVAAHRHLARIHAVRGHHAEAAASYDEVARLDPLDLDACVLASLAYVELGRFDEARDRLLAAREHATQDSARARLDEYLTKLAGARRQPQ